MIATLVLGAVARWEIPRIEAVSRLEVAEKRLITQLQQAKLRAISEDRCYQIYFNPKERTFALTSKRAVKPCGDEGYRNNNFPEPIDDHDQIRVEVTAQPVFDTWGSAPTPAKIRLKAEDGSSRIIVVDSEGRINGH